MSRQMQNCLAVWKAWSEGERELEDGNVGRESRDEERQYEKYKGIDFSRRSCPVLSPTVK